MIQRFRRSFRKKKASVCINCDHTTKECYHKEYENIKEFAPLNNTKINDNLKWLDLDQNVPNNLRKSARPRNQHLNHLQSQRPRSAIYNDYSNVYFVNGVAGFHDRNVRLI